MTSSQLAKIRERVERSSFKSTAIALGVHVSCIKAAIEGRARANTVAIMEIRAKELGWIS